jgi:hypothetical protein
MLNEGASDGKGWVMNPKHNCLTNPYGCVTIARCSLLFWAQKATPKWFYSTQGELS